MKYMAAVFLFFLSFNTLAVSSTSYGKMGGIRIEGTTGLVTLPQNIDDGTRECSRVWVDLTKDFDRAAYSTFLMAFAADKTVHIRAESNGSPRYGACDFYDIYIPREQ